MDENKHFLTAKEVQKKLFSEKETYFEMANLPESKTGVKGVIYISTKQGSHGPRIKYFEKPGSKQSSISISISDDPKVLTGDLEVDTKTLSAIFEFVKNNQEVLLNFWYKGDEMMDDEVQEMKNNFIKS
ncbi:MAG: hypothetical protein H7A23_27030 [Leptospiraceae bacterium]|nr:hypothetical protein [Leptospiraceae bacterium]